jgi:endonuclease/exonuclease/phosphatase family metal-dependent hydrolase
MIAYPESAHDALRCTLAPTPETRTVQIVAYVRIGTLNLWGNPHDRLERLERTAHWMAVEGLDVLAVQEVAPHEGSTTATVLAEMSSYHHATPVQDREGVLASCAVLTRVECAPGELLRLPGQNTEGGPVSAAVCWVETGGEALPVASVHLAWGSLNERLRLDQAKTLVSHFDDVLGASEREAPALLCGDLNAWPDSESVRYLRGRSAEAPATMWTDAWERPLDPSDSGTTSSANNEYARFTALGMREGRDAVVDAGLLPDRRIDYIFSRGWRHGRIFSPVRTRVVRAPLMSDHYAVVSDLILG